MKKLFLNNFPNFITICNLFCGCISISFIINQNFYYSVLFIYLGAILDFFDGFFARILKAESKIGKELDSFADLITFGLAPSFIIYHLFIHVLSNNSALNNFTYLKYFSFILVIFSAIRLVNFNNKPQNNKFFIGLPTPANALFLTAFPFLFALEFINYHSYLKIFILMVIIFVQSFLMISDLKMIALKSFSKPILLIMSCLIPFSIIYLSLGITILVFYFTYIIISLYLNFKVNDE